MWVGSLLCDREIILWEIPEQSVYLVFPGNHATAADQGAIAANPTAFPAIEHTLCCFRWHVSQSAIVLFPEKPGPGFLVKFFLLCGGGGLALFGEITYFDSDGLDF